MLLYFINFLINFLEAIKLISLVMSLLKLPIGSFEIAARCITASIFSFSLIDLKFLKSVKY